jgi:hypothetical protein
LPGHVLDAETAIIASRILRLLILMTNSPTFSRFKMSWAIAGISASNCSGTVLVDDVDVAL